MQFRYFDLQYIRRLLIEDS